ncbi:AI-2E family transporter [Variovorax sp. HJSM1_2]|uniref:AI-2E family transporter n=1 Tax=Variovorax sp. HJSM1_2 TaxID=3366263 RepID=UPI003BC0B6CF
MNTPRDIDISLEKRRSSRLMDVLIRAGLVFTLTALCYRIFAPFISLMTWALILAVTLFPAHQKLARRLGGKQGLAATILVLGGTVLIVAPMALLLTSMGASVHGLVDHVQGGTFQIPAPPAELATWPIVGQKAHAFWTMAHTDLPVILQKLQPQLQSLAVQALEMVAGLAGTVLLFLAAFIVAGIVMAFGHSGSASTKTIFGRIVGDQRGAEFANLTTATIRAVAMGVLGVAFIQAIAIGIVMMLAAIPFAGLLAMVLLVLGVAQIPALVITLPAIAYLWIGGSHETVGAVVYSILLFLAGMLDNVLKPLLLGRGVDAPMPIILIGALGGLASAGILGMFIGATLLALGYQTFMWWVANDPYETPTEKVAPALGLVE